MHNLNPMGKNVLTVGSTLMTGGRLKRVADYLKDEDAFCFTYGDGVSDVNIRASIDFHNQHGKLATITAVQPPGRYGALERIENQVIGFSEKPRGDGGAINGGFFVLSPKCIEFIKDDQSSWEGVPLTTLAEIGELMAFEHNGFWQPMDTYRESQMLNKMWFDGIAPWKNWQ